MKAASWMCLISLHPLLIGCRADSPAQARVVTQDSAGVQIIRNSAPRWRSGEEWRLSMDPVLDLSATGGGPRHEFFRSSARRLEDGRIVVADGGSSELRFFSAAGEFLTRVGRPGTGPGEFRQLTKIEVSGDTIFAFDGSLPRVATFDLRGRLLGSLTLESSEGLPNPVAAGRFSDGTFLARSATCRTRIPEGMGGTSLRTGVYEVISTGAWYSAAGEPIRSHGESLCAQTFVRVEADRQTHSVLPFGLRSSHAVSGDLFLFGTGETFEIRAYSPDQTLRRIIRLDRGNRRITGDDIEQLKEERLARYPSGYRQEGERMMVEMPFPETMPAFELIRVSSEGHLWVKRYPWTGVDRGYWEVFDPAGIWLGTVDAPLRLSIEQVGPDFVLGVWRDEWDVEHVRMYALYRPTTTTYR